MRVLSTLSATRSQSSSGRISAGAAPNPMAIVPTTLRVTTPPHPSPGPPGPGRRPHPRLTNTDAPTTAAARSRATAEGSARVDRPGPGPTATPAVPAQAPGLVVHRAGDVRVELVPVRTPEDHEAVVEVAYGGICGSDLHYWQHGAAGLLVLRDPMLLGHEVVGTVALPAADGTGPAAGTPVAVHPARPDPGDGSRRYPADRPHLSPAGTYLGSAAHRPHTDGGFVRHLTLPAWMLRPLPAGLSLRTAAASEPASVACHAVGRACDV